jgi:hypothetical protein
MFTLRFNPNIPQKTALSRKSNANALNPRKASKTLMAVVSKKKWKKNVEGDFESKFIRSLGR